MKEKNHSLKHPALTSIKAKPYQFIIRFNADEKILFNDICKKLKFKNKTLFFRNIIKKDFIYINLYRDAIKQLIQPFNNLNQIARYANTNQELDNKILNEIEEIKNTMNELSLRLKTL